MTSCDVILRHVTSHDVIMPKGLWGSGTLQHGLREVRQRSGVLSSMQIIKVIRILYAIVKHMPFGEFVKHALELFTFSF